MPELESLTSRAAELSAKVDFWNNAVLVALVLTAIAAAAIVVAQRKAFVRASELSGVQDKISHIKEAASQAEQRRIGTELAAADARAKEADARIAEAQRGSSEANERATQAQESLALAEQHSAEANAKAESFRRDIATANERAAEANRVAEQERLARLQLEAQLAPRVLTRERQIAISNALRPLGAFSVQVFWYADTTEVTRLGDAVVAALAGAGWEAAGAHAQGGLVVQGIVIAVRGDAGPDARNAAVRIVSELGRNGIASLFDPRPLEQFPIPGMSFGVRLPNPQLRVMIGSK